MEMSVTGLGVGSDVHHVLDVASKSTLASQQQVEQPEFDPIVRQTKREHSAMT
jgi:hypothetical protein